MGPPAARSPAPPAVRGATPADLGAIARISLAAGQPPAGSGADPRYAGLLLAEGRVVVAAGGDGRITGWAATRPTPLGDVLSDAFVDPACHGRGVGAGLLRALWPQAPGGPRRLTFSSLHPAALPLYIRVGLRPAWPLLYLAGDAGRLPAADGAAARLVDAREAAEADARLAGPGRLADFRHWVGTPGGRGVVVTDGSRLLAAGAGSPGELAHLTCPDEDAAAAAVVAALRALGRGPSRVCLPGPHAALPVLLDHGWRIETFDLAMSTPDLRLPVGWAYSPGLA